LVWRAWNAIIRRPSKTTSAEVYQPYNLDLSAAQGDRPSLLADETPADPGTIHADMRLLHPGDADLWNSVRTLDEKLRIPVILRYYHDYPVSEISNLLHISEGTVHARLDAAREKIALSADKGG
jgi:DNA-directed RNA polymerase specialized sigma24 family protein